MSETRILSPEEISTLLASAAEIDRGRDRAAETGPITPYRFGRSDPAWKDEIRALRLLHERFAWNVSTSLSAYLRAVTEVRLISVDRTTYGDFLLALPEDTAFHAYSLQPLDAVGALELNPQVAFTMVDRMLGGRGLGVVVDRGLTEIEQNIVEAVVRIIFESLTHAWKPIGELRFVAGGRDTRPQMLQVAAPGDTVLHLIFEVRIGDSQGFLNLSLPAAVIATVRAGFVQSRPPRREPTSEERRRVIDTLARVPVPVTASLAAHLSARDLVALQSGDVIALGHAADDPVEVSVGGVKKFTARLVALPHGVGLTVKGFAGRSASGRAGDRA